VEEVAASPAVALVVDRARAVRPDFTLTQPNARAVAELCRRLEGLPLAIELAAVRTRLLDPEALLGRLGRSLDALGTGTMDMPGRQRTLRATVAWSVGLLEEAERSLLETLAILVDGWTVEAAAQVASLDEDRALDLTEALARHSLIFLDVTEFGRRPRMLETIRVFVAERLAARPDVAEIGRRHADYYRALAEQADRPLRGASQSEWVERLQAEAGNLAAAVRWYLTHDPGPLPHLFRVLWPFWSQRDHLGEARSRFDQLLPAADSLDPQARAELLWTVMVTAREVGDDAMALSARQRLAPLLEGIADPYLHAASQLAMAWTSPIVDDLDGALREASASLEEFRDQDEPLGTTAAGLTLGSVETTVGRYDDALRHLTEARDLAVRLDDAWLTATSQVLLGTLALVQGRLEDAQASLEEALELSLAARSTHLVTLCLAGFACWRSWRGMRSGRRCWRGRPRACAGGSACGHGPCTVGRRPRWWTSSARPWWPTASARSSPPAPDSTSGRRWPPCATSAAQARWCPEPWPSPAPKPRLPGAGPIGHPGTGPPAWGGRMESQPCGAIAGRVGMVSWELRTLMLWPSRA
jgi:tetratricopeptide (TPR) repeat protein